MTTIRIDIDLDDEHIDPIDETGLTEESYEALVDAVNAFGTIADGPTKIED